jgi:hypothetical protein
VPLIPYLIPATVAPHPSSPLLLPRAVLLGLQRKRFFHFRKKRKSCENGVIFAKFREISFRENFRFRESFRRNFRLRENFRENFCQKIVKKSGQNMIILKSKIFA